MQKLPKIEDHRERPDRPTGSTGPRTPPSESNKKKNYNARESHFVDCVRSNSPGKKINSVSAVVWSSNFMHMRPPAVTLAKWLLLFHSCHRTQTHKTHTNKHFFLFLCAVIVCPWFVLYFFFIPLVILSLCWHVGGLFVVVVDLSLYLQRWLSIRNQLIGHFCGTNKMCT